MKAPWASSDLHITVGVYPVNDIDLQQDIKLIKAALLYADKVTIYSPTISSIQIAMQLGNLSDVEQLHFLEMVIPYLGSGDDSRRTVKFLRKLRDPQYYRSPDGQVFKNLLLSQFDAYWMEIKHVFEHIAETAGMSEVITAINSGFLEIHQFSHQTNNSHIMRFMADSVAKASGKRLSHQELEAMSIRSNEMTKEFVDGVLDAVVSGSTFPLFDYDTGHLVQLAQEAGHVSFSNISQIRTRHIALASDLFKRLPVFDKANTKDILVIRSELDRYLIRFRQSIINFASSVISNPWDNDFEKEMDLLFRKEIGPSIIDLEDEIKSNNFLERFARQAVDKPLLLTPGATLSIVLSQFPNLPKEIVGGLGLSASAATLVYNAYKEWSDKRRVIERNGLFFYYQAGRKLERLS